MRLVSIKTLHPTDELTISYTDRYATRKLRAEYLSSHFFFDCKCDVCRDSNDDILLAQMLERITNESDNIFLKLKFMHESCGNCPDHVIISCLAHLLPDLNSVEDPVAALLFLGILFDDLWKFRVCIPDAWLRLSLLEYSAKMCVQAGKTETSMALLDEASVLRILLYKTRSNT